MATSKETEESSANVVVQKQIVKGLPDDPNDCRPNWDWWREMATVPLYQAVALSCGIEPQSIVPDGRFDEPDLTFFNVRLEIATSNFPESQHPDGVNLVAFVKWAMSKQATGSLHWQNLPREFTDLAFVTLKWPWGEYTTALLEALAATMNEFWEDYDYHAKVKKGPTKRQVEKFLVEDCKPPVTPYAAQAIDKVVRPDGWRPGSAKGQTSPPDDPVHEWPWGKYSTRLLRDLAAAVNYFWADYDYSALTRKGQKAGHETTDVVTFLQAKRKLESRRAAIAIDAIIRPNRWKPGPAEGQAPPRKKTSGQKT